MRGIGVLIVGQSAVVREQIGDAIRAEAAMHVLGTASDGRRGLELVERLKPAVVVLDVQLPGLDGLQTLDSLLLARAVPVVILCDRTSADCERALAALELGAQDCLIKPEPGLPTSAAFAEEVVQKIRAVAGLDVRRILQVRRDVAVQQRQRLGKNGNSSHSTPPAGEVPMGYGDACIAVSAATGGPSVLAALLAYLRPPLPPIAVVLPMSTNLSAALIKRLASLTMLEVKQAMDGDELLPNRVLLASGDRHLQLRRRARKVTARVIEFEPVSGSRPSADVLLHSAAEVYGVGTIGVLLNGPGRDGVAGCAAIKACGGYVLGQDEASSDIYGTNKAAYLEGYVDRQCSLRDAADVLMRLIGERFAGKSST